MSNVMVTDSQMRSSLAVIRSLGRKRLNVTAGEKTRFSTGNFSRYTHAKVCYPSPENGSEFVKYLLNTLKKKDYDVIFPVADDCLLPIISNYEKISKHTKIALPNKKIFNRGYDKGNSIQYAKEVNVDTPETYIVDDVKELENENLSYPLIIKPRIGSGSRGFKICKSWNELFYQHKKISSEYGKLLIQEYIPYGGELGVYTLFNQDSKPRALSVQKRLRSYPHSGGPSTLRKTIKDEKSKKAVKQAFKLLKSMEWQGVAMVEFRIDARDGSLKLMEVNPRFWGSLQLSILAGIDFPYLLYEMLMDGDVKPAMDYKADVRCRWLLPGDILWYMTSPHKLKNLKKFMNFDDPDDIISWEDPGPTFGFFLASLRYVLDKNMWKFILRR